MTLKCKTIKINFQIHSKRKVKKDSLCFHFIVNDVRLSSSSLPNEGFVQIVTKYNGTKSVCWDSLKDKAKDVVCHQLGYKNIESYTNKAPPSSDTNVEMFSGDINCDGTESYLSQCSITSTASCSELLYITCKFK